MELILLSILLIVSIYINVNQLIKQEAQLKYIEELETSNLELQEFFKSLKTQLSESNSRIKQIDRKGTFESDDEIGFIFNELKEITDKLHERF